MDNILNKICMIINIIIPIDRFKESILFFKPLVCRHKMLYFDMVWFVDTDDKSDPNYKRFNGKVWKDSFCECQKCGVQKRKSRKVGEWGKWINCDFKLNKDLEVEVEILPYGGETKQQKRDRILNELGI
jgi:hypothetical protein